MPKRLLPNLPSDVIEVALADLEFVEADPRYRIDMSTWHEPLSGNHCAVCFAGAVMAKTLKSPVGSDKHPGNFSGRTAKRLGALDDFRCGEVADGLMNFGVEWTPELASEWDFRPTPYAVDPEEFKADMRDLAKRLRAKGF
tara:strand:+ start:156 stop:578 length:423 start_codon:yes stop_codon:yes gene_type:complete